MYLNSDSFFYLVLLKDNIEIYSFNFGIFLTVYCKIYQNFWRFSLNYYDFKSQKSLLKTKTLKYFEKNLFGHFSINFFLLFWVFVIKESCFMLQDNKMWKIWRIFQNWFSRGKISLCPTRLFGQEGYFFSWKPLESRKFKYLFMFRTYFLSLFDYRCCIKKIPAG